MEKVEACLVKTALYSNLVLWWRGERVGKGILLGTANNNRSFRLFPNMSVKNGRDRLPLRGLVENPFTPFMVSTVSMLPMVALRGCRKRNRFHIPIDEVHLYIALRPHAIWGASLHAGRIVVGCWLFSVGSASRATSVHVV